MITTTQGRAHGGWGTTINPETGSFDFIPEAEYPEIGDEVAVVWVRNRLQRDSNAWAPPKVVGFELNPVGGESIVWRVIESPWVTRKTHGPNPYNMERYEHTFRAQGFDRETGEPQNMYVDSKIWLIAATH